jgi:hypothetical protein
MLGAVIGAVVMLLGFTGLYSESSENRQETLNFTEKKKPHKSEFHAAVPVRTTGKPLLRIVRSGFFVFQVHTQVHKVGWLSFTGPSESLCHRVRWFPLRSTIFVAAKPLL